MKLYFPTTSLNFNDMFATESISPKYFYNNRNFGTSSNYITELSKNELYITLFSKMPYFNLVKENTSDYEQYPILIEFTVDYNNKDFTKLDDDIYITSKTIYFEKPRVNFFFFSEKHLKIILAKSKLVNETKLVSKYKDNFKIINEKCLINLYNKKIDYPKIHNNLIKLELEKDKFFNFIKGFYYGYICKGIVKEYNDTYEKYSADLRRLDYIENALKNFFDNDFLCEIVTKQLEIAKCVQNKCVKKSKEKHDNIMLKTKLFTLNENNELIINSNVINNNEERKVLEIIINVILKNTKSKVGDIDNKQINVLIELIGKLISEKMKSTMYRNDIALIYKRIVKREFDVDVNNLHSNVLKNFFVFVLKYNNLEEFHHFISIKNIENSHLAFAFYGAFVGFSGLSKIVTHEYINSAYSELLEIVDFNLNLIRRQICSNYNLNNINLEMENNLIKDFSNYKQEQINSIEEKVSDNIIYLEKEIYEQIKKIKESKQIKRYINKREVIINLVDSILTVKFTKINEKEKNSDIRITFISNKNNELFTIILKYKDNVSTEDKKIFKKKLCDIKSNKKFCNSICSGNYPIVNYNIKKDNYVRELNISEKEILLTYLKKLTTKNLKRH